MRAVLAGEQSCKGSGESLITRAVLDALCPGSVLLGFLLGWRLWPSADGARGGTRGDTRLGGLPAIRRRGLD